MRKATLAAWIILAAALICGSTFAGEDEGTAAAPNDSLFEAQRPYFDKMHVLEAWQITKGSPDVVIGIVDNGFDFYHPDLEGQIRSGFYSNDAYHSEITGMISHGTLVASLMVAKTDNAAGIAALSPGCTAVAASVGMIEHTLLKLKNKFDAAHPDAPVEEWQGEIIKHAAEMQKFGSDWTRFVATSNANAIRYLADQGVKVINSSNYYDFSLLERGGGAEVTQMLDDAFAYAAEKDVVLVIGAGNVAQEVTRYPGDSTTVIVAGACMLDDSPWEQSIQYGQTEIKQGSCYGPRLTVMAPVENLMICLPHEERFYTADNSPMGEVADQFEAPYDTLKVGGTSSAAPIVSSLVALVRSARPDLSAADVVRIIEQGAVDIGTPGRDLRTGYGRIDFLKTLELAKTWGKEED